MPNSKIRIHLAPVLLACSLILANTTVSAVDSAESGIYKWTDETGQVHYAQFPPANQEAEMLHKAPQPKADSGSQGSLQNRIEAMEKRIEERKEAKDEFRRQANVRKLVKANCENARKNLANLQRGANNAYMTPDGEVIRLPEKDKQKRIDEAKRQIDEYCNLDLSNRKSGG
jgi:hypothetical protein